MGRKEVLKYIKWLEETEISEMFTVDYTNYYLEGGWIWNLHSFYFYNPILQSLHKNKKSL